MNTTVEFHHVTKEYGAQKALDDISFGLQSGTVTGLVGLNGAGKSTCLRIMAGLNTPTKGEIRVLGMDLSAPNVSLRARRHIGYMPESNPLYTNLYVRENLLFWARMSGVSDPKSRVVELMDAVGLPSHRHKMIRELSKGYRQRVGLAQALLHDPEILILDEPINGLDPTQISQMRSLIKDLGKSKTVIYSTHIMQEVEATCDHIIMLHQGQIKAKTRMDLMSNKLSSNQRVRLLFRERVERDVLMSALAKVIVDKVDANSREYTLINTANDDLRVRVGKWVSQEPGVVLLEMNEISSTLEDLFRSNIVEKHIGK